MKLYKYLLILFCVAIAFQCKPKRDNKLVEKETDIANYYKNELNINVPQDGILVILQNQTCGACRKSTFKDLVKVIRNNSLPKTFIMDRYDTTLTNVIATVKNSTIFIVSLNKRKDYGLNYAADLCFLFRKNELKKWFEMSNYSLENLKSLE